MRYPEGAKPDPNTPYGNSMHDMLSLSMILAIVIGIVLFFAARRGNILWMKVWSLSLILLSVAYLIADWTNLV